MSTICKICAQSDEETISEAIGEYLALHNMPFAKEESEWPLAMDGNKFQINEKFPSILSYKLVTTNVVEIHFNSFSKLKALSSYISKRTGMPVIVNIYQSTADASYWSYHLNGTCLREIEAGEGTVNYQSGVLFDFETEPLGHDISDDSEEPFFLFTDKDLNRYNKHAGINTEIYQEYSPNWANFVMNSPSENHKPWWKFW